MLHGYWKTTLKSGAACMALLASGTAWAQAKPIDLPSEDAGRSIPELARQTGIQIIAPGQALHGVITPALRGEYQVRTALSAMLQGTELRVASDDGHTIVLAQENGTPQETARVTQTAPAPVETVTVTGSRVISDAANSPTPVTIVSAAQLQATTPTNIPDGLNKLPVFQGSSQPRSAGNGGSSSGINVLSLRNFGAQRTLILFDSHRVAPANANGTVDVDTLPQMLMSRVDVVTGGASAVYGSDAITGVVNFVLDKHFNGLKFNVNTGISNYSDGASYKLEAAAGTDLFGGRGHFEGSVEYFHQDGVPQLARPFGSQYWSLTGTGTAANPRVNTINARNATASDGGIIHCSGCTLDNLQFVGNGVVGPFLHGQATGTGSVESGGDGAYAPFGTAITAFRNGTAFGRFSYKLDDSTEFYIQGSGSEAYATGTWYPTNMIAGANTASIFYDNNPFLSPALQQQLNPTNTPGKTFQLTKFINQFGRDGSPGTRNVNRYLTGATGLDGVLFNNFAWDLYYSHSESRQDVTNYRNPNNQRWYASEDAVKDPVSGNIVCYVSTTQYANLYPGCVPMNPFGVTSISQQSYDYISSDTRYIMTNIMDDISGSIAGEVFDLPAGPIKLALSAEMRWNDYAVNSNALPTDHVNCTGLRLCSTATPLWQQNTVASATANNNVWEVSGEVNVPLLKDIPLIQSLDANLAGRYTDYSTSGAVQTWKVGLDYHVNDDIRFRGTTSIDIRAPTLNDLFSPVQSSVTSFTDNHTGGYGILFISSQGNPNLVPEVARTYTVGVVLTPSWLEGATFSYDYYNIAIKNGIGALSASNTQLQNLCEASNGTSQYCSLYSRPLPFSDHSPANYPTAIYSKSLNTAFQGIEGSDIEANYHFNLGDVSESWPGSMDLRLLVNIQPVNESQQFTGAAFTLNTSPKGHVTGFLNYNLGDWTFGLQDRWVSGYTLATQPGIIYIPSRINSQNYVDFNIQRRFMMDGGNYTAYLAIQNVLNSLAPLVPNGSGSPGLIYPTGPGGDIMGRYFTIGLRGNL
jgi:iron complex outermembrane receptor protein